MSTCEYLPRIELVHTGEAGVIDPGLPELEIQFETASALELSMACHSTMTPIVKIPC